MKKCPYCAEEIQEEAIICKHCGKDLTREPPEIIAQKRVQLMKKQTELEKNLAAWKRYLQEQIQASQDAGRRMTSGWIGVFVGLFLVPIYGLGLIIVILGLVGVYINWDKQSKARNNQSNARNHIEKLVGNITEVKMQLATLQ